MMKLNKYSWLAALPMIFTACQEDALVKELQQDKIYTLSAKMDGASAMSRAQIQFGNEDASAGEMFFWNEGDCFKLYQTIDDSLQSCDFVISSDYKEPEKGSAGEAEFSSVKPAVPAKDYIAIYPANAPVNETNDVQFSFPSELDFSNATTKEAMAEVWKEYFNNYMYMVARGQLTADGANTVSFEHQCALARVTYANKTDEVQEVGGIRLGGDQTFGSSYSFRLTGGSSGSGGTNSFELKTKGLSVAAGDSIDLYVLFFPRNFSDGEMHVTVMEKGHLALPTSTIAAANNNATGFEAGKRYWFKVTETKEGMKWTKDYSSDVVTIKNVGFARALDWYFDSIGEGESITLDENGYAIIDKKLVESTTYLWTGDSNRKNTFTTLEGIEHFVNLQIIKSAYGALEECDFSKNKYLKEVYLQNNNLKSLDFSGNTGLEVLYCVNNRNLTSVNLSRNQHLKDVSVSTTGLSSLTIPNPAKVEVLRCSNLNLNTLGVDFAQFTALKQLELSNSKYDVASLPTALKSQLTSLTCSANGYTALELSEFTSLTSLICSANNLTSLALPDIALKTLYCDQNKLSALDLSKLTTLESLMCGNQQTGTLVLTLTDAQKEKWNSTWKANCNNVILEEEAQETVTIENAELSAALQAVLDSTNVTINADGYAVMTKSFVESVTDLELNDKSLSSLEGIEVFKNLIILNCENNSLTTLDLSAFPKLKKLICVSNQLTELDLSTCPNLTNLRCSMNKLTEISVNHLVNLVELDIMKNQLTSLNVSSLTKLRGLYCFGNHLQSLDLTGCTALSTMQLGEQKDAKGNDIILELKLAESSMEAWNSKWVSNSANKNVKLYTGSSENSGNGNTGVGGSDFTIEGIY